MYHFIINPRAGNGRAMQIFSEIQKSETYRQMESRYSFTEYEGHGMILAREISSTPLYRVVIVIGGDGTIHEVMNGLIRRDIQIGFIPGGSGNDFARGCGIKGKPIEVLQKIIENQHSLSYWTGNYQSDKNEMRKFINSIGFGFDAIIADMVNKSWYKNFFNSIGLGTLSYVVALIQTVFTFKPLTVWIETNNKRKKLEKCWMVVVGNHPYYGGGMKILPHAVIQPDVLPVLIIHSISRWKVLALFVTVFLGIHEKYKEVEVFETEILSISSDQLIHYQVDGQPGQCKFCQIKKEKKSFEIIGISN